MIGCFGRSVLTGLWLCASAAVAEGISISKAEARLTDEGYQLSADFNIQLSPMVETALKHGVTLYFVSELTINRSRWYWLDTDVARDEQTAKLSFNALTQQYRITHGSLFQSFHRFERCAARARAPDRAARSRGLAGQKRRRILFAPAEKRQRMLFGIRANAPGCDPTAQAAASERIDQ